MRGSGQMWHTCFLKCVIFMHLRALLSEFTSLRKNRMAWSNWLLEGSYPLANLQNVQKVGFSTIHPAVLRQGVNVLYFCSQLGNFWGEDTKHHNAALPQLAFMSMLTNLFVPRKVLHMPFDLPRFILSLSSFCVISRLFFFFKILSILWADNGRRHFLFIHRCAFWQHCLDAGWEPTKTSNVIGSYPRPKVHYADINKPFKMKHWELRNV